MRSLGCRTECTRPVSTVGRDLGRESPVNEAAMSISGLLSKPPGLLPSVALSCSAAAAFSLRMLRAVRGSRSASRPQDMAAVELVLKGRDPLTRFDDYDAFRGAVAARLAARASGALFILRLDNLPDIVAEHGYRAGECVLAGVADRLKNSWPT